MTQNDNLVYRKYKMNEYKYSYKSTFKLLKKKPTFNKKLF